MSEARAPAAPDAPRRHDPRRDDPRRQVVVTGVGTVSAAGLDPETTWESLVGTAPEPATYRAPAPADEVAFPVLRTPEYRLEDLGVPARCRDWIEREGLAEARDVHHLLAATALALADAGLGDDLSTIEPAVAVVVADESPGFEQLSSQLFALGADGEPIPEAAAERYEAFADRFFQLNTFLLPFYLARAFRTRGLSLFVNSACSSGINALDSAAQQIRAGRTELALCAAADDPLSAAKYLWFSGLGLYADDGALRPFDRDQAGTVFGDGGAALVLESRARAEARGARIYAEHAGSGFASDGWKIALPSPLEARAGDALSAALAEADADLTEVDLVVPHGTGTRASDQYEALILHRLFDSLPPVTAFKPTVGHNLGGSALLETALLMLAMERGVVPPTRGHRAPYERHPVQPVERPTEASLDLVLKLTCGFAGHYAAAAFRRPDAPRRPSNALS